MEPISAASPSIQQLTRHLPGRQLAGKLLSLLTGRASLSFISWMPKAVTSVKSVSAVIILTLRSGHQTENGLLLSPESTIFLILYLLNLKTNQITKLTESNARNESPSWSPDGRHLVFSSNMSGSIQIYSVDYDGSHLRLLTSQGENKLPNWTN